MHTLEIQNVLFKNIIMVIRRYYLANISKISGSIHSYTCSRNFNNMIYFFYPENFMQIIQSLRINPGSSNVSLPSVSLSSLSPNAKGFGFVSKSLF
jgi:hypothetical protein